MALHVRDATEGDLEAITSITNADIGTTTIEWTDRPHTVAERRIWLHDRRMRGHPVLVAEDDGEVVAWAGYGDFRDSDRWPGYRHTVEHTVRVAPSHRRRGVGRALVEALLERARIAGVHAVVGAVDGDNEGSVRFHERLGFTVVGRLPEAGRLDDRWLDLVLVQRIL